MYAVGYPTISRTNFLSPRPIKCAVPKTTKLYPSLSYAASHVLLEGDLCGWVERTLHLGKILVLSPIRQKGPQKNPWKLPR